MDIFFVKLFLMSLLFALACAIAVIVRESIIQYNLRKRVANGTTTEEDRVKYKRIVKKEEARIRWEEERIKREKEAAIRNTISKTMIVGSNSTSRKKAGSSIVRGAIGGALLGPVGLVGGALSGKEKVSNTTTFLVEYIDGRRKTVTVDTNSPEFNRLCKYLEM